MLARNVKFKSYTSAAFWNAIIRMFGKKHPKKFLFVLFWPILKRPRTKHPTLDILLIHSNLLMYSVLIIFAVGTTDMENKEQNHMSALRTVA